MSYFTVHTGRRGYPKVGHFFEELLVKISSNSLFRVSYDLSNDFKACFDGENMTFVAGIFLTNCQETLVIKYKIGIFT